MEDRKMKIAKISFLWFLPAIVLMGALSGPAWASDPALEAFQVAQGSPLTPLAERPDFKSSLLEPREARGAVAPPEPSAESARTGSPFLVIIGLGLIAVAVWGKKKFQK
jgi:hypothetical protein